MLLFFIIHSFIYYWCIIIHFVFILFTANYNNTLTIGKRCISRFKWKNIYFDRDKKMEINKTLHRARFMVHCSALLTVIEIVLCRLINGREIAQRFSRFYFVYNVNSDHFSYSSWKAALRLALADDSCTFSSLLLASGGSFPRYSLNVVFPFDGVCFLWICGRFNWASPLCYIGRYGVLRS